jgi:2-C-methyl-D-erythritol 2,4-cyclodiphosphate synthase
LSLQRVGVGYDMHPLTEGRELVLGGVTVPFERGLAGHSDSDVVTHAIVDALLGAAALGDIGTHFPPDDPAYKDATSLGFLERTAAMLAENNWRVANVDATIIAQQPRLNPFVEQMRRNMAQALGLPIDRVSVKGKSTNGLGPEGRGEGISAQAIALIETATP